MKAQKGKQEVTSHATKVKELTWLPWNKEEDTRAPAKTSSLEL